MEHLIFLYYFLGLFPGFGAGGLAWAFSLGHQSPLSQRYLRLFSLMMIYFTQMVVVYYFIHISGFNPQEVEAWSQPLYQLIYSLYPPLVAGFILELLQIPFRGWRRWVPLGLSALGFLILLVIPLITTGMEARIEAFRFWVQFFFLPLYLIFILGLVILQFVKLKSITDPWKKKTVLGSNIILITFFPLFVLDALWPLFQMKFRLIPEGFNFFGIFFMVYSLFFLFRWRNLLKDEADRPQIQSQIQAHLPKDLPVPEPQRLRALDLTDRESEVVLQIFQGLSNQEIAHRLSISLGTVKNHIYHTFQKTGASSRRELISMLSEA